MLLHSRLKNDFEARPLIDLQAKCTNSIKVCVLWLLFFLNEIDIEIEAAMRISKPYKTMD